MNPPTPTDIPTPRCDEQCTKDQFDARQWYDFARTLERENVTLTKELETASESIDTINKQLIDEVVKSVALTQQRDELKAEVERLKSKLQIARSVETTGIALHIAEDTIQTLTTRIKELEAESKELKNRIENLFGHNL